MSDADESSAGLPPSTHHWMPSSLMRTYLLVNSTLYIGPWFYCNGMPDVALESRGKLRWDRDKEGMLLSLFYMHESFSETDTS